jgi:flagellar hook-associated protein 2
VTSSVDGLVSGMSTSALISSLMQVEAAPQTSLKSKVSKQQTVVSAYQTVNTKLASLETAAKNMGQLATWRSVSPTSTSTSVTATATSSNSNATGSVTFDVLSLAKAQVSTARVAGTGDISGNSVTLSIGGVDTAIDVSADRSAAGVAKAINDKGLGVRATVVTDDQGKSILQLSGTKTGAANAFTLSGLTVDPVAGTGTVLTPTAAADAKLQVGGDPASGGYTVSSATNSFDKLITGTSITVSKVESGVTVEATANAGAIADKMKALVDAANGALSEIKARTATSTSTSGGVTKVTGAPLSGDFMVRQISDKILSTVSGGLTGYGSLSQFGVSLTRDGTLSFDADKFKATYAKDPAALKTQASAFAEKLEKVADDQQTNVTNAVTSRTQLIKNLNDQISNWDNRLALRRESLQKQFSGLETSLGKMKSQSSWLSSQIASLG